MLQPPPWHSDADACDFDRFCYSSSSASSRCALPSFILSSAEMDFNFGPLSCLPPPGLLGHMGSAEVKLL